ncbi:MAG: hypothetical protein LBL90_01640 [Prevotellaceae bacterium]|jgi:hypothetical protein|nr:hypothetical protein [Prevotellaceae bacterium]
MRNTIFGLCLLAAAVLLFTTCRDDVIENPADSTTGRLHPAILAAKQWYEQQEQSRTDLPDSRAGHRKPVKGKPNWEKA